MIRTKSYFCDILLLSVVCIWGFNFAVVKAVYADFHPIAFNALRFAVASTVMGSLLKLRGASLRIEPEDRKGVLGLALLSNALYQFLFVVGLSRTRAGNAGLLMALTPVFAYIIGVFAKRERFHRGVMFGIVLSLCGVAAIVTAGAAVSIGQTWKGDLMMMGAAFCWGWYSGSSSHLLRKYGALRLTVMTMLIGTAILIPLSLPWILGQNWLAISRLAWAGFLYSAFLAIVYSYLVWAYALSRIGISRTAVFSNLTPIVALFGGWLLLGETPTGLQIFGVLCVLTGVYFVRSFNPAVVLVPEE